MSPHLLLPLSALLLNVLLAGIAIARNPGSRVHRVFVGFVAAMAVWNLGAFMLRRAPDPAAANLWEVVIHVGLAGAPALYYHFVMEFLGRTASVPRSLGAAYALAGVGALLAMAPTGLLLRDVTATRWGWAPVAGPLYLPFLAYLYGFLVAGLVQIVRAYRGIDSSFRRNRARLIVAGTIVTLAGGFIDFARFIVARAWPEAERLYPVGIPANMVFALLLGLSIVRYRMFEVDAAAKRGAVYAGLAVVVTSALMLVTRAVETALDLEQFTALWIVAPLGFLFTLFLVPLGHRLDALAARALFADRRGCYDTLLALSKRTRTILDFDALVDTLVRGLAHGVPLTQCALLTRDADGAFVVARSEVLTDRPLEVRPLAADSAVVAWLETEQGILVPEEARLNPRLAAHFQGAEGELARLPAALVVPLRSERALIGVLLLGEKLSGEIFDGQELELLTLLANQTATSLENARLHSETDRRRREAEALADVARVLTESLDVPAVGRRIAENVLGLFGVTAAGLRLLQPDGSLIVVAHAGEPDGSSEVGHALPPGVGVPGRAVSAGTAVSTSDVLGDPRTVLTEDLRERIAGTGHRALLSVPLRAKGRIVGALTIADRAQRAFAPAEVGLLQAFADQAALALENARLYERVRETRDFLQSIAEASVDAITTTDAAGHVTFFSPGAEDMFGYRREEMLGQLLGPYYRGGVEEARALMRRVRAEGRVRNYETALRARDGRWVEISSSVSLLRSAAGEVTGTVGISKDITERRRTEEALRAITEGVSAATGADFFRSLVVQLTGALDVDLALVGRLEGDAPGRVATLAVCEGGQLADNFEYALADTPCATVVGRRLCVHPRRVRQEFPLDARLAERGIESYAGAPLLDPAGRTLGLLVVMGRAPMERAALVQSILQVSAVRAAAELERLRLEEERARLASAVEQAAESILITRVDGTIVYVNPAFERMTGYGAAEIVGQSARIFESGHHPAEFYEAMWRAVLAGQVWSGEVVARRKDGALRTEERSIAPVRDERGQIIHCVSIAQDVTERKELESQLRQAQKLEAVGRLAGGIAHDFNNLLTVIRGRAQLTLSRAQPEDPARRSLGVIVEATDRAAALTRQLLAFSRKQAYQPVAVDLDGIVTDVVPFLRRLIGEDIEIVTRLARTPTPVRADPAQLEQLVMNLALNARDAMPGGGRLVIETAAVDVDEEFARTHPGMRPGPHGLLAVLDTGTGMSPDVQAHIFEPFFTTKEPGKGTGLGLAMVYGIVAEHGGTITVESEVGQGTTFRVYLPSAEEDTAALAAEASRGTGPAANETVLLVEDEAHVRDLAREILEQGGYVVLPAANPDVALQLCDQYPGSIDLLLTDVVMPQMSGPELAARVHDLRPGARVLFMSGYADDALSRHGVAAGGTVVVNKPFTADELIRRVREVLEAQRA